MSLKAKLEAVIYAAEEPVTLAQLAAIFAVDAFEWKAEQEAALAEEAAQEPETTPFLGEDFGYVEAEAVVEAAEPQQAGFEKSGAEESKPAEIAGESAAAPEQAGDASVATSEVEGELKRQARQRDRERQISESDHV